MSKRSAQRPKDAKSRTDSMPPDTTMVSVRAIWSHRETLLGTLSNEEQRIFDRLRLEKRKRDWLAGRIAAKRAVQKKLGLPFQRIVIDKEPEGRPILRGVDHGLHLSISHSSDLALATVAEVPVGIDLERIEDREPSFETLVFSEEERRSVVESADRARATTELWCLKEAYSKWLGRGLREPFHRLSPPDHLETETGLLANDLCWALVRGSGRHFEPVRRRWMAAVGPRQSRRTVTQKGIV